MSKINKNIISHFVILPRRVYKDANIQKRSVLFHIFYMMCYHANNETQQLFVSQAR